LRFSLLARDIQACWAFFAAFWWIELVNVVEKNEGKGGIIGMPGGSIVALLRREDGIVIWCLFVIDILKISQRGGLDLDMER
jgi:hypothetical protein